MASPVHRPKLIQHDKRTNIDDPVDNTMFEAMLSMNQWVKKREATSWQQSQARKYCQRSETSLHKEPGKHPNGCPPNQRMRSKGRPLPKGGAPLGAPPLASRGALGKGKLPSGSLPDTVKIGHVGTVSSKTWRIIHRSKLSNESTKVYKNV